jgi:maleylpyruvate isomerase
MDGVTPEIELCVAGVRAAHQALTHSIASLTDDRARSASLLPDWTVGHVLTHVARNADSFTRMFEGAIAGSPVEQYDGGRGARSAAIEAGATRSATELIGDVVASCRRVEETYQRMTADAWASHGFNADGTQWPCAAMPFHRWREVELHHADLGLGYSAADWPDLYVERELSISLDVLPERLNPAGSRAMLAWLVGRAGNLDGAELAPWQSRPDHYYR